MGKRTEKKGNKRFFNPRLRGHVPSPTLPVSANRSASKFCYRLRGSDSSTPWSAGFGLDNDIFTVIRHIRHKELVTFFFNGFI